MQEVTEWNGKPRWMWCWDFDENVKDKDYVVCILTEKQLTESAVSYPVRATINNKYLHCAEIEEEPVKETRLTNYELTQLLKCFGVDYTWGGDASYHMHNSISPLAETENEELQEGYKIRYKQGEWEEPTRETVWKWYNNDRELLKNSPSYSSLCCFISFMGWDKE